MHRRPVPRRACKGGRVTRGSSPALPAHDRSGLNSAPATRIAGFMEHAVAPLRLGHRKVCPGDERVLVHGRGSRSDDMPAACGKLAPRRWNRPRRRRGPSHAHAHADTGQAAARGTGLSSAPRSRTAATATATAFATRRRALCPQRPLLGNAELGGNRIEVEHVANEDAQRDHQFGRLHRAAGHHVVGGLRGKTHLCLGAQQDHVGKRCFDRVTDAPAPVRRRRLGAGRAVVIGHGHVCRGASAQAKIAQVARVHGKLAGERAAEHLVGRDERLQPLVDLPVLPLAPLLHAVHDQQADADRHDRHEHQPQQGR
ncbi:hypothetical protein VVAX_05840 [Variovorax paradoxus]|uniref:Uncharacterized protein n=2 Tax=Variovorax paradoxus TaxID=34073 RepID=A0A679JFQ9_VARPD|nr:hypothetical protein VVAX_05840 [Variovorax paradoxus]